MIRPVLLMLILLATGCGGRPEAVVAKPRAPEAKEPQQEFLGEIDDDSGPTATIETKPAVFELGEVEIKHTETVEHRSINAVLLKDPANKAAVREVARVVWDAAAKSIEEQNPGAQHKRISIRVYYEKSEEWNGRQVLYVANEAAPDLPPFEDQRLEWNWRNPALKPPEEQREVNWEFQKRLLAADKRLHAEYEYPAGADRKELFAYVAAMDKRMDAAGLMIKENIAEERGWTVDQVQEAIDNMSSWLFSTGPE